jgi:hypothetical protein
MKRPRRDVIKLPPTVKPDGPGYFPLYCAVQWIATCGDTQSFDPADTSIWNAAYRALTDGIASNDITVTGVRNGVRKKIKGHIFAGIRIEHAFSEASAGLLLSDELYLCSYSFIDHEYWQKGFDDSLKIGREIEWSKVMVLKSDVAKIWPFSASAQNQDSSPSILTGAPGRPTPMHLVVAEHRDRLANRKAEVSVTVESERLAEWLSATHPNLPALTAKTIRNKISTEHREGKTRPK